MAESKTSLMKSFNCILHNFPKYKPYCCVCFHVGGQRSLVRPEAFRTLLSMLNLEVNVDFFICHICEKYALTALHFCKAVRMAIDVENLLEKFKGKSERFEVLMKDIQEGKYPSFNTEIMKCEKQLEAIRNRFKLTQSKIVNVNTKKEEPKPPRAIAIKPNPPKNINNSRKRRSTPYQIVITTNRIIDTPQKIATDSNLNIGITNEKKTKSPIYIPSKTSLKQKTVKKLISTFNIPITNTVTTQVLIEKPTSVSSSMPVLDPLSVSDVLPGLSSLPPVNSKPLKPMPVSDQAPTNPSEILLHPIVIDAKGSIDVPSLSAKIVDGCLVYQDPKKLPIIVMKKPEVPFALNTKTIHKTIPLTPVIVAGGFKKSDIREKTVEIKKKELVRMATQPMNVIEHVNYPNIVNQSMEDNDESLHESLDIKEEYDDPMADDDLLDDVKPTLEDINGSCDKVDVDLPTVKSDVDDEDDLLNDPGTWRL